MSHLVPLCKGGLELSKQQIGASKRLGYGVLDWHIELNGESMFSTICDKEYIFNKKIEMLSVNLHNLETLYLVH